VRTLWMSLVIVSLATLSVPGCVHTRAPVLAAAEVPGVDRVVFAADGAGNFQMSSMMLRSVAEADGLPIDIITYEWSHGNYRIVSDQICYRYARAQGEKLAAEMIAFHQQHPCVKIYLWGHSAGAAVVLAALEASPPCLVEGMVLLAPSVSAFYDLRPALCRVACHLDVFHSSHDCWYLGLGTRILGTSDKTHRVAAGRFGFRAYIESPEDECLYSKLRQHPWHREDKELGHNGNHYGGYQPDYLRAYIMPLFFNQRCCPPEETQAEPSPPLRDGED
jgi:pimeloyl-ACP methyl ester carboxylesterase